MTLTHCPVPLPQSVVTHFATARVLIAQVGVGGARSGRQEVMRSNWRPLGRLSRRVGWFEGVTIEGDKVRPLVVGYINASGGPLTPAPRPRPPKILRRLISLSRPPSISLADGAWTEYQPLVNLFPT